jgi:hypothetical protein
VAAPFRAAAGDPVCLVPPTAASGLAADAAAIVKVAQIATAAARVRRIVAALCLRCMFSPDQKKPLA